MLTSCNSWGCSSSPIPLPTIPSPPATIPSLDNLTPALVHPPLPPCPCISAYCHMPRRCYKTIFSCYTNGRKYSFGNLTSNSCWGYADPVCPRMTSPVCWESNPNNRLKSPPQHNRTYDLDSQIYKLVDSTHHLLSDTNPSLAEDCWLCLSPVFSHVLANPISFNLNSAYKNLPPHVVGVTLTHPVSYCFQSPQGKTSIGKIPKELCNKTTPVTALSFSL
jgi:hypothetical protein